IKFKAGNYYHLKLFVNKKITLTTTKKDKGKVKFIGNVDENAINIKANKVKIYGLKFKKYNYVIIAKTTKSVFSKNTFYNNMQGVKIKGKKNKFIYNKITFSTLDINGKYNIISQNKLFKKSTISVHGYKNIIQKNSIKKTSGIHLYGKKNSVIHNKIYNGDFGISVAESKYCKISNNKLYNMYCGITIESSSKNTFNKNTLIKCKYGVMYEDNTNKFSNNIFKNCEKNFLK
ncbi:MAG: hypothetical protein LBR24_00215, partial [Methanobrevibacter sp.]|nr:hypothetical protein [Methanobrevibacter sp.]